MDVNFDIILLQDSGFKINPLCYKCKKSEAKYYYAPSRYSDLCIIENTLNELKKCKEKENVFGIDSCINLTSTSYNYDSFDDDNINKIIGWYLMRLNNYGISVYYCIYIYNKQITKYCIVG